MDTATWTKDERNLLIYLETCLVDQRGFVRGAQINTDDIAIATRWHKEGFLRFGRRPFREVEADPIKGRTHWVWFTDLAWVTAHRLRRDRAARMNETYAYTEEGA